MVYKLTVSNMSEMPIVFKISFAEEDGYKDRVNLSWPANGIKGSLPANDQTIVALLPKIRPSEPQSDGKFELEKLKINISWKSDLEKL